MQILNIILPVLNEEQCLATSIHEIKAFLDSHHIPHCLTIADNGSTDATPIIARELCAHYAHIEYLRISQKGVGIALRESILHNAKRATPHSFIGYMDIDLSTSLEHLREVYDLLVCGREIVVGSRLLPQSSVYGRNLKREISSRGLNLLMRLVLGATFSDAMCGFKFYNAQVAQEILTYCSEDNGWFYCAQMLLVAQYHQIPITQIPIIWHDDSHSKVKIISLSLSYLKEIARLFVRRIQGKI